MTTIVVTPASVQFDALGLEADLSAQAFDQSGQAMSSVSFTWMSSDPGVASVAGGLVTSVADGQATVTAAASGIEGNASVTVAQVPAAVAVTPDEAILLVGESIDLVAEVVDANSNPIDGAVGAWDTSDPGVATVTTGGQVLGIAAGTATVSFEASGVSGSSAITVPVGLGISIDFETYADGSAVCGGGLGCGVSDEWSTLGVVFDFVDGNSTGGGIPTIADLVGNRVLANDRRLSDGVFLTGSVLMIFTVDLYAADFSFQWPTALFGGAPAITVYDASGQTVASATVDRPGTLDGIWTVEAISVVSPVPIGSIKVGIVGGIFFIDDLVY